MVDERTLKQKKMARWGGMQQERAPWINRYRVVTDFLLPFAGRYFREERNRGDKTFNNILDETATLASRVLSAGLMAGMTSPARPWFRLALEDRDMMEFQSVKEWLNTVTNRLRDIFSKSNAYRMLPMLYEELGAFGTAASYVMPDFEKVLWYTPLTAGEYAIATDARGRVNTLYREYEMTVEQMVGEFVYGGNPSATPDWSVVSSSLKNLWDSGRNQDKWRPVLHAVEPRPYEERVPGSHLNKHMPFRSLFLELGNDNENTILRDSGFKDFPALGPRWLARGGDIMGYGPGFEAIGSIKQLQHEQHRKSQAIDFMSYPPMMIPGDLKGGELDNLPGGANYYTSLNGQKIQRLFDVQIDLSHLLEDIQDVRARINRIFYVDLFQMMSLDQARQPPTAREVVEKHEEKLLMLGPVLERLHDELLAPMVDSAFTYALEAGLLPPPPQELQRQELKIEFISVLAQAQRAVGLQALDRLIGTVGAVAQSSQDQSVWDKVNKDQLIDEYAERLAVDPSVIVADEKVLVIRAERVKQQQMARMAAMAKPAADAAKAVQSLGNTPADNPMVSAAGSAIRQYTGL